MRNENEFIKADKRGRGIAINYLNTITGITNQQFELYESNNGCDKTDLSMTATTSGNSVYQFEIECKNRVKCTSIDYDNSKYRKFKNNDGSMIEIHKYNDLCRIAQEKGKVPMYVMTYPDNTCLIFNLNNIKEEDIISKKTTRGKTEVVNNNNLINTECYYLNKDKATVSYLGDKHLYTWQYHIDNYKKNSNKNEIR